MSSAWFSPRTGRTSSPKSQRSQQSPQRSQQSPQRSQQDESTHSPPSQPSQQSGNRSHSPSSRFSNISSRLRGRKKQLPRPPVPEEQPSVTAKKRTGIIKRGVVTIRSGIINKEAPLDYRVEAYLDDCIIGQTPLCSCCDYQPLWDYTMKMCDLELGADLILRIVCKRGWPHKDAEVARGVLPLDQDSFARRYIEDDVEIFFQSENSTPERLGEEHMADIRVHIDFDMPTVSTPPKKEKMERRPILWSEENGLEPSPPELGSSDRRLSNRSSTHVMSGGKNMYRHLEASNNMYRSIEEEDEIEVDKLPPTTLLRDTGAGVALPRNNFKRQQIVDRHYWDPVSSGSSMILCTPMIVRLLQLEKWVPCWPRHTMRKEDEEEY